MHFKGHGTVNHKFFTECPSEKGLNPFVYLVENDIIQWKTQAYLEKKNFECSQ